MKKKYAALVLGLAISMTGTSVYAAGSSAEAAATDDESNAGEGGDGYCNLYIGDDCTWTITGGQYTDQSF